MLLADLIIQPADIPIGLFAIVVFFIVDIVGGAEENMVVDMSLICVRRYARVSMESERLQHSLSAQISYYNEKIQKNPDWLFAGVYTDDGISGTGTAKRDEFNRLIDDCNAGRIDLVLTKSISRFARNTVDLLETVRHLKDIGVEVWFERENIHSMDGDGEVMLSILASFAQEESRSISENVKWGTRKRFEKGIPNGHFRVYGYRWEGDELVPVSEEATIVKRIFQNFLDGKSRLETEREFAAEGITTRDGCPWVDSNIKQVLSNITYTGNMLLQKEYIADPISKKRKKNHGELPQFFVEGTHEPIIDKETFDYVQAEMERRRKLGPLANKSLNITCFTGKIKCEKCGKSLMRNTRTNRAKNSELGDKLIGWVCGSRKKKGSTCTTREIPDRYLRQACAEAMETADFDEELFKATVDYISVPENGILRFHFMDGTEKLQTWVNTAKKDAWTSEARARASEYRREHAARGKKGSSCFTAKIKCQSCGCNFRRQTQNNVSCGGKISYFRCTSGCDCDTPGLREDHLKGLICKVLGIAEFDEDIFLERVERILVYEPNRLVFMLKDGTQDERIWNPPNTRPRWSLEQRQRFTETYRKKKEAKLNGKTSDEDPGNGQPVHIGTD